MTSDSRSDPAARRVPRRARRHLEAFEFAEEDPRRLVEVMERLGELRSGWVNLLAGVRPEDVPEAVSPLGAIFSSPSADAPMCTWVPGRVLRRRTEPARIGISHSSGPSAVARLAALGLHIPAGWRVSQDHLRRGLVVVVCEGEDASTVAGWMLRAGAALSKLPLTGEWRAEVYERSTR